MGKHRLVHTQDLGPLGLPSDLAAYADDWREPGSLEERHFGRRKELERRAARKLGPARARGRTFDLVLDDYAAGFFLPYSGNHTEARFTLSFKHCRRVEWLAADGAAPRLKHRAPMLRPAKTQALARELESGGYLRAGAGFSAKPDGQGMELDLSAGWVESFEEPFTWIGRFSVWGHYYVVVECRRVVVVEERKKILRDHGGDGLDQAWLDFRRSVPPDQYARPEGWIEASSLPDLRRRR